MILVDTSVCPRLPGSMRYLLWPLFPRDEIGLTPAVFHETMEAIDQGCGWLNGIPALVNGGRSVGSWIRSANEFGQTNSFASIRLLLRIPHSASAFGLVDVAPKATK